VSVIKSVTPVIAKTAMAVAIITFVLSVLATVMVGAPQLLLFTGFSTAAGLYAWRVAYPISDEVVEAETTNVMAA
jgi:type IV secretory pathway protease TraF